MGSTVSSDSEYFYSKALPWYIGTTLRYPTCFLLYPNLYPWWKKVQYVCIFASVKHLDCISLYYAAATGCSDLFLEACCHMLVTAVCEFVREEDRRTACVFVQIGMDSSNTNWRAIAVAPPDKAEVVACTFPCKRWDGFAHFNPPTLLLYYRRWTKETPE